MTGQRWHRRSIRLRGFDYASSGAYFVTICTQERRCLFGDIVDDEMQLNDLGRVVREEWIRTAALRPYVTLDEFVVMPNHLHGIIVLERGGTARPAPGAIESREAVESRNAIESDDAREAEPVIEARGTARRAPTCPDAEIASDPPLRHAETRETGPADVGRGTACRAPTGPAGVGSGTACRAPGAIESRGTIERFGRPTTGSIPTIVRAFKASSSRRINALRGTLGAPVWQRNYYERVIRDETSLVAVRQYIAENPRNWLRDRDNPLVAKS